MKNNYIMPQLQIPKQRALSCVCQVSAAEEPVVCSRLTAAYNKVMHLSVELICCITANHPV